jgi:cytoskeleton protein RodZ
MSDAGMKDTLIQQEAEQQKDLAQFDETAGAQLAKLRNAMGWSVEQVAEQLNLAPRQVVAIEQNDFAALPGMAIARGFIRAYAKLLKADVTPLLAAIPGETTATAVLPASRPDLSAPFSEARIPFMYRRGTSSKSRFAAVVLVLLLVAALAAFAMWWRPTMLGSISAQMDKQVPSLATSVVAEKKATVDEVAPSVPNSPADVSMVSPAPVLVPAPVEAKATVSSPPVPAAVASSDTVTAKNSSSVLVLKVHEDSWVQIKRSDASTLVSRILKAGETESFDITEPVLLTVGNAAGVEATLRGLPLNMKPKNNSNTIRLKLE